jgi:hypothetical protein
MSKRRNRINCQFAARPIEMLESPAYRVLSLSAHRVITRIEIELAHHGGNDNGKLPVTKQDFIDYGIHDHAVAPAIREAEALGFIRVTERGRGGNAEHRQPNKFFLAFAHGRDSRAQPPTHEWGKINTMEEAEEVAQTARNNKDPRAVRFAKLRRKKNKKPVAETTTETGGRNHHRKAKFSGGGNRHYSAGRKPPPLSISRGGGRGSAGVFAEATIMPRRELKKGSAETSSPASCTPVSAAIAGSSSASSRA